jgi:hypothetical protein
MPRSPRQAMRCTTGVEGEISSLVGSSRFSGQDALGRTSTPRPSHHICIYNSVYSNI